MEREWSGNARRLSRADRAQIESLIRSGATFEATAEAGGCSTKSIQRFLALTGGLKSRLKERSSLRLSLAERKSCHGAWSAMTLCGRSRDDWEGRLQRFRGRWLGADLAASIGRGSPTNGLLRQYFPAKADLSVHSSAYLNAVARELNNGPRQTLGWMKPQIAPGGRIGV